MLNTNNLRGRLLRPLLYLAVTEYLISVCFIYTLNAVSYCKISTREYDTVVVSSFIYMEYV